MASKTSSSVIRIRIAAGKAAPSSQIGPALGQRGVKAMDFCKQFNERTKNINPGIPIPTLITVNKDRSFSFVTKTPETTYFIKNALGIEKGSSDPSKLETEPVGILSLKHIYEIAKIKHQDAHLGHKSLRSIVKGVIGTARSMGVKVVP